MSIELHLFRAQLKAPESKVVETETGRPVPTFPMEYTWQKPWKPIFDLQVQLIQLDIRRARAEDRVVVYLSCPLSSRGGGFATTNVDIASHTQRRLLRDFGHRFWFLNPAAYQLESKEGTGLILQHAKALGMSDEEVAALPRATGGDYMRMWTRVLVEDDGENLGRRFDGFYFIGPTDVRDFMTQGGALSVTAGVEAYFASQYSSNVDFRDAYSIAGLDWGTNWAAASAQDKAKEAEARQHWEDLRKDFLRYYALRAGASFSMGSHDEWNIFRLINEARLAKNKGDVSELLAGYFDGRQLSMGAAASPVAPGYEYRSLSSRP